MLPDFFVVGAQKAGSTYLLRCLAEHPEVYMPPTEIAFFEDTLYDPEKIKQFESCLDPAKPGQRLGVKRPNLLCRSECPERLHRHMPELKVIVMLRHPVERAVSGYFHYMKTGFLPVVPAEQGLRELLRGGYQDYPRAEEVLEFGLYHKHLSNYHEYFSADQMFVNLLDDMKQDAAKELGRVYEFIGVDPSFQPPSVDSRPMGATYSIPRLQLWNRVDQFLRVWSEDRRYFHRRGGVVGTLVNKANVALDRYVWQRLYSSKRPQLSQALEAELIEFYRKDVAALEGLLGRSLSMWKGF